MPRLDPDDYTKWEILRKKIEDPNITLDQMNKQIDEIAEKSRSKYMLGQDTYDWTLLHYAVQNGRKEHVARLIQLGADVNARNSSGTILHMALKCNNYALFKYLLTAPGINVDAQDGDGFTSLHRVVFIRENTQEHVDLIKSILASGGNVNAKNRKGESALHIAVVQNYGVTITEFLLKNNATVDLLDSEGNTPLHLVGNWFPGNSLYSYKDKIKLLMLHGAQCDQPNRNGTLPSHGKTEAREFMREMRVKYTENDILKLKEIIIEQASTIGELKRSFDSMCKEFVSLKARIAAIEPAPVALPTPVSPAFFST